jgi:hypothetical protein
MAIDLNLPTWQEVVRMTLPERGFLYAMLRQTQNLLRQTGQDHDAVDDLLFLLEQLGYWIPAPVCRFLERSFAHGSGTGQQ